MAEMKLKGLKSQKSGIWGQNNVVSTLLGPKRCCFGALEVFFFFERRHFG